LLLLNGPSQSYASSRTTYGALWGKIAFVFVRWLYSAELMKTEKLIDSFASAKARKKKFFLLTAVSE